MKRKVIRVGPSTLMVSLPNKWVQLQGIKKGEEIDVMEVGNTLHLGISLKPASREITVSIPTTSDYLARFITAPYIKGYDCISIKYNENAVYSKVLETAKLLIGFEVVENTDNSCKLVNLSTAWDQKFELLLNRLFIGCLAFGKDLSTRLQEGADLKSLQEYEDNINRIHLFCRRFIQTQGTGHMIYSPVTLYAIVVHLEEVADCFRLIMETIGKQKVALRKQTRELFSEAIQLLEILFKVFSKISQGEKITANLDFFKEHKRLRQKHLHSSSYFQGDEFNSAICARLLGLIELSHHVTEELFD